MEDKAKEDTVLMPGGLLYICFSNTTCTLRDVDAVTKEGTGELLGRNAP